MGVYLPNMEMPTNEYGRMTITIYPNGNVAEYIGDIGRNLGPAVTVPPHGRLIDADALSKMFDPDESFGAAVLEIIADTPTILQAEKEGK